MIDEINKKIYLDFSTGNTFQACKEKCHLAYTKGYRMGGTPALDFGHAIHAGIAGLYDAMAGGWHDDTGWHTFPSGHKIDILLEAHTAFLRDLKYTNATIPVNIESEEKRSVERGLALIDAYKHRWRNDPYVNILRDTGEPYTEVPFKVTVGEWQGYEIIWVGHIDRLMMNQLTHRPVIFETKTTSQGLETFIKQVKPNHQITTYFGGAWVILPEIRDCIWDCIFVSDRKSDMKKALLDRFWLYGVDVEKDFRRQTTSRSSQDVTEWMFDAMSMAIDYAGWMKSGSRRWPRSAPSACHQYGGCQFRDVCPINGDDDRDLYLASKFTISPWQPWLGKEFQK